MTKDYRRRFPAAAFSHLSRFWHIYLTFAIFFVIGLSLAYINRNQINPDGYSYYLVARDYSQFHIKDAVNGYWSPLLSWLLVPFLWFGVNFLFAYRIFNFLLCILVIGLLIYYLNSGRRRAASTLERWGQVGFIVAIGTTLQWWGSTTITPDLLSGVMLLAVILCIYRLQLNPRSRIAIAGFGLTLALLYFAKAVGFYVSLGILILLIVRELYASRKISRHLAVATAIFLIIAGLWAMTISLKYEHPTVSTAGSRNFGLINPARPASAQEGAATGFSLSKSYSPDRWPHEDHSYDAPPAWSITGNLKYYVNHVLTTLSKSLRYLFFSSPLVVLGILTVFLMRADKKMAFAGYLLIFAAGLVVLSYSLILVESRYLWIVAVPLMAFVSTLFNHKVYKPYVSKASIVLAFVALGLLIPTFQNARQTELSEGGLKYLSEAASASIRPGSSIAGTGNIYKFCFFSDTRCLGSYKLTGKWEHDKPIIEKMQKEHLKYYAMFSKLRLPYMTAVYRGYSQEQFCYDYKTGKNRPCEPQYLSVYKI